MEHCSTFHAHAVSIDNFYDSNGQTSNIDTDKKDVYLAIPLHLHISSIADGNPQSDKSSNSVPTYNHLGHLLGKLVKVSFQSDQSDVQKFGLPGC